MRYSLANRFKGALLGAFLGQLPFLNEMTAKNLDWLEMVISGIQSLIDLGKFESKDWHRRKQQIFPNHNQDSYQLYEEIVTTLPVALFFHESTVKLRQSLLQLAQWHNDPVIRDGTLVVGYAIALCLTEKLSLYTVIPQTISFLGESSSLSQQLLKINYLLKEQAGLERVQAELVGKKSEQAITIAFYCFLRTLEDFRLSVLLSHRIGISNTSVITGVLSGAYNSVVGIPVSWQLLAQTNLTKSQLTSFSQMLKLADALVYVWSGVYDTHNQAEVRQHNHVIAAPRVIR